MTFPGYLGYNLSPSAYPHILEPTSVLYSSLQQEPDSTVRLWFSCPSLTWCYTMCTSGGSVQGAQLVLNSNNGFPYSEVVQYNILYFHLAFYVFPFLPVVLFNKLFHRLNEKNIASASCYENCGFCVVGNFFKHHLPKKNRGKARSLISSKVSILKLLITKPILY